MGNHFRLDWVAEASDEGKLLKTFLNEKDISRSALTDIKFKGGALVVNEEHVTVRCLLSAGDCIEVHFPQEEPSIGIKPENIPLDILFEDDYLLVINKLAGMNTIPSREHPNGSLANAVLGYYGRLDISATTHIVTRLDRDTSGIVLVAKHRHIHHLLSMQQKANKLKRVYVALAEGYFPEKSGIIEEPIARKSSSIIEREVNRSGQYACTYFHVLQQFTGFSLIELELKTGRTHQIRVHLSFLQHPLLGDDLYGGTTEQIERQALHCQEIEFFHPISMKRVSFSTPLPTDMKSILTNSKPY